MNISEIIEAFQKVKEHIMAQGVRRDDVSILDFISTTIEAIKKDLPDKGGDPKEQHPPIKTREEILEAVCAGAFGSLMTDGGLHMALSTFFPIKSWGLFGLFLREGVEPSDIEVKCLTREAVTGYLKRDMYTGFQMHRHSIPAPEVSRKIRAWLWILNDGLHDSVKNINEFDLPSFKGIAKKYGFPIPRWCKEEEGLEEKPIKTREEILEAVRAGRSSKCLDGRDFCRLARFFPPEFWDDLDVFAPKGTDISNIEIRDLTRENLLQQLKEDVAFGFQKALNKRGLSSGMMYEAVKMWMWVLNDELQNFDDYAPYGLPLFEAVAEEYGFPIPEECKKEPEYDDSIRFCPSCEKPNQFGEVCHSCRQEGVHE